jgi:hypothetical protein
MQKCCTGDRHLTVCGCRMLLRSPTDCAQSRIGLAEEGIHRGRKAVVAFASREDGAQPGYLVGRGSVKPACLDSHTHIHSPA